MTTKNIIPQADGEGSIGINGTSWASGVFNTGVFEEVFVGGDNVVLSSDFGNALNNYVSKSEIFIGANGYVGIGTANPTNKLEVRLDSDKNIAFKGDMGEIGSVAGIVAYDDAGTLNSAGIRATDIRFANLSSEVMRISSDGNLGIGTPDPQNNLHISGSNPGAKLQGAQPRIWLKEDDTTDLNSLIRLRNSAFRIDTVGDDDQFQQNRFTILNNDGNVGINTLTPAAKLDVQGDISISGAIVSSDSDGRVLFSDQGLMVGQAEVKPDPDDPESLYFAKTPQVQDSEGNPVTILTADKLGLGTSAVLESSDLDLQFKLLTDEKRFVVGTSGNAENTIASGWYRFNDFQVKGATDIGSHPINPVDTRIYSDESSFILFKTDINGNRVAHLVGGDEDVSPNNAIALGIAVKVDSSESPQDVEFVHTDGESYSVINGNSDSVGTNGLPLRQGFQNASLGSNPAPLLIDGGSF